MYSPQRKMYSPQRKMYSRPSYAMRSLKPDSFSFENRMRASQSDLRNHATVLGRCEDVDPVELEKPGEVLEELIEDQKQAPVELFNDLKAAIEVNSTKSRRVLYPRRSMTFQDMPLGLEVSLRDDPSIHAICKEYDGTQLCMSSGAFGKFGAEVQHFIEQEDVSIQREERLKEQRIRELKNKAWWALIWPFFKFNCCLWGAVLVFLVICLIVPLESYAVAVALCLGAGCLCCCAGQISWASLVFFAKKNRGAKRVAKDLGGQDVHGEVWRQEALFVLFAVGFLHRRLEVQKISSMPGPPGNLFQDFWRG